MHMKMRICLGSIGLVLAACEPAKEPIEKLTFEQLQQAVETCKSTGKIATDNYCKEALAVYEPQDRARREKARIAKALADPGVTFVGFSKK